MYIKIYILLGHFPSYTFGRNRKITGIQLRKEREGGGERERYREKERYRDTHTHTQTHIHITKQGIKLVNEQRVQIV